MKEARSSILVGGFNALKKFPEKQGKGALRLYDYLRFDPKTPEEKKVKDKIHTFLKKHQKEVGLGLSATYLAVISLVAAKGYKKLRNNAPMPSPNPDKWMGYDKSSITTEDIHARADFFRGIPVADSMTINKVDKGALQTIMGLVDRDDTAVMNLNSLGRAAAIFIPDEVKRNPSGVLDHMHVLGDTILNLHLQNGSFGGEIDNRFALYTEGSQTEIEQRRLLHFMQEQFKKLFSPTWFETKVTMRESFDFWHKLKFSVLNYAIGSPADNENKLMFMLTAAQKKFGWLL